MLAGVCIGTNDLAAAGAFYDEVLAIVGFERQVTVEREIGYGAPGGRTELWVLMPFNGEPATYGNGTQVMFTVPDEDGVRAFYEAVIRLGGTDEGAPGPRDYSEGYYGAYCRDLDGNKLHVFRR